MEFYRNAMIALDLQEWDEVKDRIGEQEVVAGLHAYVVAYLAYKSAAEDYETDQTDDLWRAYTKTLKDKKNRWSALQAVLGEDVDYIVD
jgi:hypothetical protein